MTPTQPTPEEQVEAGRIAGRVVAGVDAWRAHVPEPEEDKPGGLLYGHEDFEPVARAYLALLTQQSQERAERPPLEADATPIGRDWVEYAKSLEAELDRAVEREKALRAIVECVEQDDFRLNGCACTEDEKCYMHAVSIPKALTASPGKGAEGEAGAYKQCPQFVAHAPHDWTDGRCPGTYSWSRDPEAAPIEDEEKA